MGFLSGVYFGGPVCSDDRIQYWEALFAPEREFPVDMAGFSVHLRLILEKHDTFMSSTAQIGSIETDFLEQFSTRKEAECRGTSKEVNYLSALQ